MSIATAKSSVGTIAARYIESGDGIITITNGSHTFDVSLKAAPFQLESGSTFVVKSGWCAYKALADSPTPEAQPTAMAYGTSDDPFVGEHDIQSGGGAAILTVTETSTGEEEEFYIKSNNIAYPFDSTGVLGYTCLIKVIGEQSFMTHS